MSTPVIKQPIKISNNPIEIKGFDGKLLHVDLYVTSYVDPKGLAVVASKSSTISVEMYGKVSASLPESRLLPDWAFFAKHWSENSIWVPSLLENSGLFEKVDIQTVSGYIQNIQAWKLKEEVVENIKSELKKRALHQ